MARVKICGITNVGDALIAAEYGADALGFVFYKGSPRYISPDEARKIVLDLPPFVTTVGVFVDERPEEVERIMDYAAIDLLQFHGQEPPEACIIDRRVIKAIRIKDLTDLEPLKYYRVSAFLLDTYAPQSFGGTGQVFNWDVAADAKQFGKIILAGGLTPDNVEAAIRRVRPYAVDVSSGVEEQKGRKDHRKLRLFIERAKSVL
jgi:phosphoribosylanthranilate isomerase